MNSHCLEKLEYNKIIEYILNYCNTYLSKNIAENLKPCFNKDKIISMLNETKEALYLLERKGSIPVFEINDISIDIKNLESNRSLSAKALLNIANVLKLSKELKHYFFNNDNFPTTEFPIMESYFSSLYTNASIEESIFNSIVDENTISDNASKKLSSLRRNRKNLEIDIKETLNKMLHSSYSKYIMESIVTIRNDRYVIPVKEEYRSLVKGFVHDISASGSTLFIEPMQVFELNNKIHSLKIEENIEIENILENLSKNLIPYISELKNDIYFIGKIDFSFAKANFAKEINGICPNINDSKQISLLSARHPLINKDSVVPIDILIGKDYSSLIITGPNTGGKTVCLKTTGLLLLMAYSGLFIPAGEKSSIYIFDSIFADIGDEQSIQESLSTFSSHMVNIINIIKNVTSNSLVLVDELGSGTDPIEGSNLAVSILEYFNKLGCITLATTHYQEIKNYALVTEGFENASSDFDIENLKPTYKLLIGIPGKSNAFAISKKLGLPENILNRAKSLLKSDDINIEELLKNIYDDKILIESQKEEISKNLNQIEALRKSLEQEKISQKNIKDSKIEKSRIEASNILLSAKDDANEIIKELNSLYNNWKDLNSLDISKLSDEEIASFVRIHFKKDSLKKANNLRNSLNNSLKQNSLINKNSNINTSITKDNLSIGTNIRISGFSDIGRIISIPNKGNQVQVQIGSAKMNIKINSIVEIVKEEKDFNKNISNNKNISSVSSFKSKNISSEINVIGQNIEEACFVIDKYLDDCSIAKLSPIRIVHGKGTGKLREGIHSFLRKNPHVKSFRLGTFGEGEMGVTIVELK